MSTQRKKYIIDKKFQLKTTFSIIGVVTILTAVILGSISFSIVYNNEKINNIYDIESSIMEFFSSQTNSNADEAYKTAFKFQMNNHNNNMENLKSIITYNRIMLITLLFLVIIQGIILYILLIKKTHHISGPIFVMSRYLNEMIEGKFPVTRPLREKDELKEFYELFNNMIDSMKEKDRNLK
jgi:methyl-accepting chemotaxis protein